MSVDRLRELADDWDRYGKLYPAWSNEMRRAVVIEMRIELERLAVECGLERDARPR